MRDVDLRMTPTEQALSFGAFIILIGICLLGMQNDLGGTLSSLESFVSGNLTASQIAQLAVNAGFTGANISIATAIALAESSGNPQANGDTAITPGGSVGLWQINLAAHPEFAGENLYDPATNANAAYSVWSAAGGSFSPWSTYGNGAYQAYLSQAEEAVNANG
jgi:hypothetical protein